MATELEISPEDLTRFTYRIEKILKFIEDPEGQRQDAMSFVLLEKDRITPDRSKEHWIASLLSMVIFDAYLAGAGIEEDERAAMAITLSLMLKEVVAESSDDEGLLTLKKYFSI